MTSSKPGRTRKELREYAMSQLKTGAAGVEWFNQLSRDERILLSGFRGGDFSKYRLDKINFRDFNLQETNFTSAKLKDACLRYADLKKSCFHSAKAQGINLLGSKSSDADLNGTQSA
ncbi:pentapeptide repeat-containing protein [Lignipirellula cremea]|uniref:Pentapeptide repeats (8 copies) n=1 Tax=Lignipirellula cremea TaxID=2528010 RepID=A0A518DSI1_9BACT|nr:pentapeptide repeat-containing protein [Lignipirellula cremea]QDU94800.1 Pentapeptide repeats (8 copies) [Lignipirellula cremea]